jgi:hypothetical protein
MYTRNTYPSKSHVTADIVERLLYACPESFEVRQKATGTIRRSYVMPVDHMNAKQWASMIEQQNILFLPKTPSRARAVSEHVSH